jgi:hypothetical protein
MRLATRLHSGSLIRCQRETGARQFVKWQTFFQDEDRQEIEKREKWEYYAARLSSLILCSMGQKVTDEQMLIGFKSQGIQEKPVEKVVTKEERIKEAKAFWGAFFEAHKPVSQQV